MRKFLCGAAALACLGAVSVSAADTPEEAAARFALRPNILNVSLSPSGDQLAYISAGPRGSEVLNIVDLRSNGAPRSVLSVAETNSDLTSCAWATEERLVCNVHLIEQGPLSLVSFTRLLSVDTAGANVFVLTPRQSSRAIGLRQGGGSIVTLDVPGKPDRVLMTKEFLPEESVGTRLAKSDEGLGVEEVNITNGRRAVVERPTMDAADYIADETGEMRLRVSRPSSNSGMLGDKVVFHYRPKGSDRWSPLSEVRVDSQTRGAGFWPIAVDSKRNVAFGVADKDGFDALYELPLTEGAQPQLVMARADVDVDRLITLGRQGRVVGVSWATEKREIKYFDPELAKLAAGLRKALPGQPLIDFAGASADESKLLIVASSDTDPGMTYLYNKSTGELNALLPLRPMLAQQAMGSMQPVTFPASDGTQIPGYLTLPPGSTGKGLPAIVMPHGGPSARDEWGFDWMVQYFVSRGYAVLQPNYRGSSGYGSAWFGHNGFKAWPTAVSDVNDAGKWLTSQGIAAPGKLAIVGWSYGGYAALQSQVADPSAYKAVVAIAPVTDLDELRDEARNFTNFNLVDDFIGHGEHVESGSPARHAGRFAAPVMLFHGTLDQNVGVGESRLMERKLKAAGKRVEYVEFEGLDHGLQDSMALAEMLKRIDAFLAASLAR